MKSLKSTKGFTLVELIVVIAILGILAAVAVPAYTGYINKAKEAADMQVLSNINTAVQGLTAGKAGTVKTITVTASGGVISEIKATADPDAAAPSETEIKALVSPAGNYSDVKLLAGGTFDKGATWAPTNGGTWTPKT